MKTVSKTTRKATGNHVALYFSRRDINCAIVWKDNGKNEFKCYMMVALLHSNGQLRTERDGDTEKGCQKLLYNRTLLN